MRVQRGASAQWSLNTESSASAGDEEQLRVQSYMSMSKVALRDHGATIHIAASSCPHARRLGARVCLNEL